MRRGPIYRTPQPSDGTGCRVSHFAARMPPEMQPPASTPGRELITIPAFVLVEGRKRRDSNPRYLSARSLSRSSTQRSAMTTLAVWAGHRRRRDRSRALLIAGECNHKCNHCGCVHRNVRPPAGATARARCVSEGPSATMHTFFTVGTLGDGGSVACSDARGLKVCCSECRVVRGNDG
jgi:hypothetical protein